MQKRCMMHRALRDARARHLLSKGVHARKRKHGHGHSSWPSAGIQKGRRAERQKQTEETETDTKTDRQDGRETEVQ